MDEIDPRLLVAGTLVRLTDMAIMDKQYERHGRLWVTTEQNRGKRTHRGKANRLLLIYCKSLATGELFPWYTFEIEAAPTEETADADMC